MDERRYMVVDLERKDGKKMFITRQIKSIKVSEKGFWTVSFEKSQHVFNYNRARLLYFDKPKRVDLGVKGLYIGNKHITDVAELFCFSDGKHTFYHIVYTNGYEESLDGKDVYITRTPINEIGGGIWGYLKKLADETGLLVNDDENLLSKQYDLVDLQRDNVPLAVFIGGKTKLKIYRKPYQIYYPFGCNASQKAAVEAALTHQVSIVQGPPGTGKTQTILNIISNLLLDGKTILVVSNNNSAVENVAEKLDKEGLGFFVAQLGNAENKQKFIENQADDYPDMTDWLSADVSMMQKCADEAAERVTQGFEGQTRLAVLKVEADALKLEKQHKMLQEKISFEDAVWLEKLNAKKLMQLLTALRLLEEKGKKPGFWQRIRWAFSIDFRMFSLLRHNFSQLIACLEHAFYDVRAREIEQEMAELDSILQSIDMKRELKKLSESSVKVLKGYIGRRYKGRKKPIFALKDLKMKSEAFLKEYPIVLSSTYMAKNNINKTLVFDYVIMDEASQVDIKTGALALSCANNAVIVGDSKQLANVVNQEEKKALDVIWNHHCVAECYNSATHSFLEACLEVFKTVPNTLLREHYRCHPKIIEFCNQRFYDGELIPMTTDLGEKKVLRVIKTVKGNHARGHLNQREIDVICQEVMPEYAAEDSIGIITPYRDQAKAINKVLQKDIASTVHKYQGRECDIIIMSMVDNLPTAFSDDNSLLNVAISRAKAQLCIVVTGNDMPQNTNLAQLIAYVQYHNFKVKESRLYSVFDLLYSQYTIERLAFLAKYPAKDHPEVSEHLSERLLYHALKEAISKLGFANLAVVSHYPISKLIADWNVLDASERAFAENPHSHVDFLVYNPLTKRPLIAIEVDGWAYHQGSEVQQSRDELKDGIFRKYALSFHRIRTTDSVTVDTLKAMIEESLAHS